MGVGFRVFALALRCTDPWFQRDLYGAPLQGLGSMVWGLEFRPGFKGGAVHKPATLNPKPQALMR